MKPWTWAPGLPTGSSWNPGPPPTPSFYLILRGIRLKSLQCCVSFNAFPPFLLWELRGANKPPRKASGKSPAAALLAAARSRGGRAAEVLQTWTGECCPGRDTQTWAGLFVAVSPTWGLLEHPLSEFVGAVPEPAVSSIPGMRLADGASAPPATRPLSVRGRVENMFEAVGLRSTLCWSGFALYQRQLG